MPCHAEFRDPTQPAYPLPTTAAYEGSDNELVLSAIWISSQSRRATINGVSGRQGQIIHIKQASSLDASLANTAVTDHRNNGPLNNANTETNRPAPENIMAPLLASEGGSDKQQINTAQHAKTADFPAYSSAIKIISIHKNSVTIAHNGERKTLQLVQRPYKTQ